MTKKAGKEKEKHRSQGAIPCSGECTHGEDRFCQRKEHQNQNSHEMITRKGEKPKKRVLTLLLGLLGPAPAAKEADGDEDDESPEASVPVERT